MIKVLPTCLAVVAICALEAIALVKGVDGVLFSIVIAVLSGLGGYEIKGIWSKKNV